MSRSMLSLLWDERIGKKEHKQNQGGLKRGKKSTKPLNFLEQRSALNRGKEQKQGQGELKGSFCKEKSQRNFSFFWNKKC